MKNQAIIESAIKDCIYSDDLYFYKKLNKVDYRDQVIQSALNKSIEKFASINLDMNILNGKNCFSITDLPTKLLIRKLDKNIRSLLPNTKSRGQITRQIKPFLKEGTKYKIYKLDIKSFYESINKDFIIEKVLLSGLSKQSKILIKSFLECFWANGNTGIPRGVEISPPLADLLLAPFDLFIRNLDGIFYSTRFVDDILIITNGQECHREFYKTLQNNLPIGLTFNYNKKSIINVEDQGILGSEAAKFDFLGYEFKVKNRTLSGNNGAKHRTKKAQYREVFIDLTDSKLKKIKTKISRSIYLYQKHGDFYLLVDRLAFLSSNRNILNKRNNKKVVTGFYYNHCCIDKESKKTLKLDHFLKSKILACNTQRNLPSKNLLSQQEKRRLLENSFGRGFRSDNYKRFSPQRLREIKDAWRY
ncbi:MAG: hypothetical protein ACJAYB_001513 [Psychromonas sp.]